MRRRILSEEELATLRTRIRAILNLLPVTQISEDSIDVLCANDFTVLPARAYGSEASLFLQNETK